MLMGLALAAFQPEMDAQSRGNSRSSSTSRSTSSTSRQSSGSPARNSSRPSSNSSSVSSAKSSRQSYSRSTSSDNKQTARPSGNTAGRPSGQPTAPSAKPQTRPETPSARPDNRPKPDISPADRNPSRPSGGRPTGTRPSPDKPAGNKPIVKPEYRPKPGTPKPDFKPGNHNRPVHVHHPKPHYPKPHPRDREFTHYSKPAYHWASTPHYYGYRVRTLPVYVVKRTYGGITYYYYNDIWYRPYNGYYVVCRPPFGTSIAANLIADLAWAAVRISYYNTVANSYSQINDNNRYIAEQNSIIAQNNATIAAQNQMIAQSQPKAQAAYSLANELGLVQSYAAAGSSYFYQDGVFYSQAADGQYYVIVPPAGALVETLPEDFDTVILNGKQYYRVDDTIYQMTISEGKPYFEVLGQIN